MVFKGTPPVTKPPARWLGEPSKKLTFLMDMSAKAFIPNPLCLNVSFFYMYKCLLKQGISENLKHPPPQKKKSSFLSGQGSPPHRLRVKGARWRKNIFPPSSFRQKSEYHIEYSLYIFFVCFALYFYVKSTRCFLRGTKPVNVVWDSEQLQLLQILSSIPCVRSPWFRASKLPFSKPGRTLTLSVSNGRFLIEDFPMRKIKVFSRIYINPCWCYAGKIRFSI